MQAWQGIDKAERQHQPLTSDDIRYEWSVYQHALEFRIRESEQNPRNQAILEEQRKQAENARLAREGAIGALTHRIDTILNSMEAMRVLRVKHPSYPDAVGAINPEALDEKLFRENFEKFLVAIKADESARASMTDLFEKFNLPIVRLLRVQTLGAANLPLEKEDATLLEKMKTAAQEAVDRYASYAPENLEDKWQELNPQTKLGANAGTILTGLAIDPVGVYYLSVASQIFACEDMNKQQCTQMKTAVEEVKRTRPPEFVRFMTVELPAYYRSMQEVWFLTRTKLMYLWKPVESSGLGAPLFPQDPFLRSR
jgi:hypothetical protein